MLDCCKTYDGKITDLLDDGDFIFQSLEYGCCPVCGQFKAKRIRYDNQKKEWLLEDWNKKTKAQRMVEQIKKRNKFISNNGEFVKSGNKSNMAWIFGLNKELKNKQTIHRRIDFNGTDRGII